MKYSILAILIALSSVKGLNSDLNVHWENFVQKYNKNYNGQDQIQYRRSVWENNLAFIEQHNLDAANGIHTFTVGMNEYGDLTTDEFVRYFNGFNMSAILFNNIEEENDIKIVKDLPEKVDWRTEGYVTEVKNQGHCGSCWAFSATGSLEGQHFNKTKNLTSLSEQNLVDCDHVDHGCGGGIMMNAFEYIIKNKGIDTEESYPYKAKNGEKCLFEESNIGATLTSYKTLPSGDEKALQNAVATIGPISVAIDASRPTFHFYKKGLYHEPDCSSKKLDHGVLAVGYGGKEEEEKSSIYDYWLVKNSWGKTWGMEGYIKMSRNRKNNCGIATIPVYPIV